jgi:AraC-like DNA-binding protein
VSQEPVAAFKLLLRGGGEFESLLEELPDVCFFVKDRDSRLMMGNQVLVRLLGQKSMDTVVGRTGSDFFPKGMADAFHDDDRLVMQGGIPLHERVELMLDEDGTISWFCTTKQPLFGTHGEIVGLKGITRNLGKADPRLSPFARMLPVISAIQEGFRNEIDLTALARLCNLSSSQFRRSFRAFFRMSPLQFILKIRIQAAANLLTGSRLNITEIARRCGFSDPNYFSRQFYRQMGLAPLVYRKRHRGRP